MSPNKDFLISFLIEVGNCLMSCTYVECLLRNTHEILNFRKAGDP